jgi:hypothetical protein
VRYIGVVFGVICALGLGWLAGCGGEQEGELPEDMASEEYIHHTEKDALGKAPGVEHKNVMPDPGGAGK